MTRAVSGQVDKVIRITASSQTSWEDAARAGVAEAAKTIRDLQSAKLMKADLVVRDDVLQYRVKLEMAFRLDRNRIDATGMAVQVKRYLLVANQTLTSPALRRAVRERITASPAEFHVLVPQAPTPAIHTDPSGLIDPSLQEGIFSTRAVRRREAEERLGLFVDDIEALGGKVTGEVAVGDPLLAVRRVMERSSFDEIIVSTLPPGLSRWLRLDLPTRLARSFSVPITSLIQRDGT
jgi:flavin-binding protein dodecin